LPQVSNGKHEFIYIEGDLLKHIKSFSCNILVNVNIACSDSLQSSKIKTFIFSYVYPITVLVTDIIKSFLGHRLKNKLTNKNIILINRIVGGVLIVFGAYLIISKVLKINPVW
jgi:hypothetical protein